MPESMGEVSSGSGISVEPIFSVGSMRPRYDHKNSIRPIRSRFRSVNFEDMPHFGHSGGAVFTAAGRHDNTPSSNAFNTPSSSDDAA